MKRRLPWYVEPLFIVGMLLLLWVLSRCNLGGGAVAPTTGKDGGSDDDWVCMDAGVMRPSLRC